ncbi:capping complex subunit for YIEGIA [Brevibacillus fulvus]|uniref:Uncharacterized protein n=1 Tax=Brevibacillus fulvus TaxID=1125967 RepID=A0A938Y4J7_9BACL|nr:hypothetical protein [Brevibacillus fulvus]MBM7591831.1 hypothetical protein [Brevibacillus fulvus]
MAKIAAIVVTDKQSVGGGAPIFIAKDQAEQEKLAFSLEKILDVAAHDLKNGMIILVDHSAES